MVRGDDGNGEGCWWQLLASSRRAKPKALSSLPFLALGLDSATFACAAASCDARALSTWHMTCDAPRQAAHAKCVPTIQ